jgi:hypothetical protein
MHELLVNACKEANLPSDISDRDSFTSLLVGDAQFTTTFQILKTLWNNDYTYSMYSSSNEMKLPAYNALIGLGTGYFKNRFLWHAFEEMAKENVADELQWWHEMLVNVSGVNPIPQEHSGNLQEITDDWLRWAEANGYYVPPPTQRVGW